MSAFPQWIIIVLNEIIDQQELIRKDYVVQARKEDVPISSCVEIHYSLKPLELPKNYCDKVPVKLNFNKNVGKISVVYIFV